MRGLIYTFLLLLHKCGNSCLKSSGPTKSNPQSATISTPFRFRSEERAVKRKEASSFPCPLNQPCNLWQNYRSYWLSLFFFFSVFQFLQRMDETKSKEEEKVKLQRTLKVNNFIITVLLVHDLPFLQAKLLVPITDRKML